MNKERLLLAAKACRETKHPDAFSMDQYSYQCGTPGCVLGNLAVRPDLQNKFTIDRYKGLVFEGRGIGYWYAQVCEFFDVTAADCEELFSTYGCGGGRGYETDEDGDESLVETIITDPIKAAEYIEDFVKRHEQQG